MAKLADHIVTVKVNIKWPTLMKMLMSKYINRKVKRYTIQDLIDAR